MLQDDHSTTALNAVLDLWNCSYSFSFLICSAEWQEFIRMFLGQISIAHSHLKFVRQSREWEKTWLKESISSERTLRMNTAGLPAHNWQDGISVPGRTTEPAATILLRPTKTPELRTAFIPMTTWSSIVQEVKTAPCPIVTWLPTVQSGGYPDSNSWVQLITTLSWIFENGPTLILCLSPLRTAPYQTLKGISHERGNKKDIQMKMFQGQHHQQVLRLGQQKHLKQQ